MDTLNHLLSKWQVDLNQRMPIEITGVGRRGLAHLFNELGYRVGAEIGVETGLYTQILCEANPQARIYAIDAWIAYSGYRDHVSQDKLDGFYREATNRLKGYNCQIIREFSIEALEHFPDNSLDFVYIDGNHSFESVTFDIVSWTKKVEKGGIISGHDYRRNKNQSFNHVKDVVQAYTNAYRIKPWFVLREEKGAASFMWVKGQTNPSQTSHLRSLAIDEAGSRQIYEA